VARGARREAGLVGGAGAANYERSSIGININGRKFVGLNVNINELLWRLKLPGDLAR
jgi:hypothetical protein